MQVKETHIISFVEPNTSSVLALLFFAGLVIFAVSAIYLALTGRGSSIIGMASGSLLTIAAMMLMDSSDSSAREQQYRTAIGESIHLSQVDIEDNRLTAQNEDGHYVSGLVHEEGDKLIVVILEN